MVCCEKCSLLESIPCANACRQPGLRPCSACRLVSYCSEACQKSHWKYHKKACKNPMRSRDWQPAWVVENRLPAFLGGEVERDEHEKKGGMDHGCTLWGNTPAFDLVNLPLNENNLNRDLALAFPASGDLRHVVKTINSLPSDYSGKLTLLINDGTMAISCRNLVILLLLGTMDDGELAADVALHFWYSILLPEEYKYHVWAATEKYLDHTAEHLAPQPPITLGSHLDVTFPCTPGVPQTLKHGAASTMTPESAKQEYLQMRNRKSKQDYYSRMYFNLKPSHRVAFQKYRETGVVLPFGASLDKFTDTNQSLFMQNGSWFQTDLADPLYGWDIREVIASGKAHGVTSEDIYGCLYFYLSDQLRSFHQRLRKFSISFKLFSIDATELARMTRGGIMSRYGIPPSVRFDRVFVSNIFDQVYVGVRAVLESWAPLLSSADSAAIVGYLMNWFTFVPDGEPRGATLTAIERRQGIPQKRPQSSKGLNECCSMMDETDMLYDNSNAFMKYLKQQGLDAALRKTGLHLRKQNAVVPQRFGTQLGAPSSALPAFKDDEERYLILRATAATWKERFVEFSRK